MHLWLPPGCPLRPLPRAQGFDIIDATRYGRDKIQLDDAFLTYLAETTAVLEYGIIVIDGLLFCQPVAFIHTDPDSGVETTKKFDLIDSESCAWLMGKLNSLAIVHNCLVVLIHHRNKNGAMGESA
jgi:hypothetical protein